jgi:hypothetical protein
MSKPKSFRAVIGSEFKKFAACIDEMFDKGIAQKLESGEYTQEQLERLHKIYSVVANMVSLFYEDYISEGPQELIRLYPVDTDGVHKLKRRDPSHRPKLEAYTASLRAMTQLIDKSYIFKGGLATFGLEELRKRFLVIMEAVLEFLKYTESVIAWTEKYLSWIEHAADLAVKYENARRDEDAELTEPVEFYSDPRVRLYATLKTTDSDPAQLISFLGDLSNMFRTGVNLFGLVHRLYASLDTKDFHGLFNMLTAGKARPLREGQEKKFKNVSDLNEYIRSRVEESVESDTGFVNVAEAILNSGWQHYIAEFVTDFMNLLTFFPENSDQELFIKKFEKGRLWPEENSE